MKGYREKCIEGGMNDYVSKPLNREELLRKIEGIKIERKKVFSEEIIDRKYLYNIFGG